MNLNRISSNTVAQLISSALTSPPVKAPSSSASGAARTDVSGPAQLMGKLVRLKQTDPVQFQETVSTLAASLKASASAESGNSARVLNDLAGKLEDIAKGGDIAQLSPTSATDVDGGSPISASAARAYRSNSAAFALDKADISKPAVDRALDQLPPQSTRSLTIAA